jgi:arylsulfatase A-like enzyme
MLVKGPGFSGGRVITDLVSLIDLPPTILAAAGAEVPDTMQGRPLQGLVAGMAVDWPEDVFLQISETQVGRAIRTHRWKYSVYAPEKDGYRARGSSHYLEQYL